MSETRTAKKSAKSRTMYMHTLNRKAATWDGENVVLCYQGPNRFLPAKLYRSIRTLGVHVAKSAKQSGVTFGWVEVEVPAALPSTPEADQ